MTPGSGGAALQHPVPAAFTARRHVGTIGMSSRGVDVWQSEVRSCTDSAVMGVRSLPWTRRRISRRRSVVLYYIVYGHTCETLLITMFVVFVS